MRTTLAIDTDLLRLLKQRAAKEGRTLQSLVNDLLRQSASKPTKKTFKLKWRTWKTHLQPGVELDDRDKLYDLLDGPRGFPR